MKVWYWRALQAVNALKASPMLEFDNFYDVVVTGAEND